MRLKIDYDKLMMYLAFNKPDLFVAYFDYKKELAENRKKFGKKPIYSEKRKLYLFCKKNRIPLNNTAFCEGCY